MGGKHSFDQLAQRLERSIERTKKSKKNGRQFDILIYHLPLSHKLQTHCHDIEEKQSIFLVES